MAIRDLTPAQQLVLWIAAYGVWWLVTAAIVAPELRHFLRWAAPFAVVLFQLAVESTRRERLRRPPPRPEPPPPPPAPTPPAANGNGQHANGKASVSSVETRRQG